MSESFAEARGHAGTVEIARINPMGLERATAPGSMDDLGGLDEARFIPIGSGRGEGHSGAVDEFAIATLRSLEQGRTLVVLLIDQSRSVLYGDLPKIIERMDHYFSEIDANLIEHLRDRGRWVVVGFGRSARVICEPTYDLNTVKQALRAVEVDPSGVENTGQALDLVLARYGGAGYKRMLIGAITDEAGDDIINPALLERLIVRMREANANFYVFGYEAVFSARKKHVSFVLDPKVVRGADREAIRGFEGRTIYGWEDAGPECPRPELWWATDWYNWNNWGGSINGILSGFGMYGLNRMVLATRGMYFLLGNESKYDKDKLYAGYRPDICSILQYEQRMAEIPLRRALYQVWREMGTYYMGNDLRSPQQIEAALDKSARARTYCMAQASELKKLLDEGPPAGPNPTRWEAQAAVTIAELLRFRFMLGQYYGALLQTYQKAGRIVPPGKRYVFGRGKAPDDYVGPKEAKEEYDMAHYYIQKVLDRHKGTPWEVLAVRIRADIYPWKCSIVDLPAPPPPGYTAPPSPPSLAF
jgi:hypothetical protein